MSEKSEKSVETTVTVETLEITPVPNTTVTAEDKQRLTSLIEELQKYQTMQKEVEEIIDSLKDELKSEMKNRDVEELKVGIYKMHYTDCMRTDFDKEALKRDMPVVFERYIKTTNYKRFSVN